MGYDMKFSILPLFAALAGAVTVSGCTQTNKVEGPLVLDGVVSPVTVDERKSIAAETCEVQYQSDKQNYLSAVQSVIASTSSTPDMSKAPLERFRAEINAAYNTMVARCKTHTNCLEVKGYDEAACYISASDRKDAERRFSDLAERLREIERDHDVKAAHHKKKKKGKKKTPVPQVTVTTTVNQNNEQKQKTHVGDKVEDQDVVVLCSNAGNLLRRECRSMCEPGKC